ncbi:MAG: L-serine ammonia-lyase, iron-sulfur-dependent, subunit alpha [Akkermansiaceae bacterium]|jgi:L-serine dehydratase
MKPPPSIFNDVLGPVMRGPSSSHSAAANRIGRIVKALTGEPIQKLVVRYDPNGSLVTTHKDQGSDLGLHGGLLGWTPDDPRLPGYELALKEAGIEIELHYESYNAPHPNFYRLEAHGESGTVYKLDAISTGGGMIETVALDGVPFSSAGDYHHLLLWISSFPENHEKLPISFEHCSWHAISEDSGILNFSLRTPPNQEVLENLISCLNPKRVRLLPAVLPVLARKEIKVPFSRSGEMLESANANTVPLWKMALRYEAERGGIGEDQVMAQMDKIRSIMEAAIATGLGGTSYEDRILPSQSPGFKIAEDEGRLIPAGIQNAIIRSVSAIMEVKSSMGVIVAAPTAGSCGAMPGAVLAVANALGKTNEEKNAALLLSGMIGVFITLDATFAAEEGGCMAECGSASAMAAAAITWFGGGTNEQQMAAASLALQNSFGMVCDPIANRVEAPCLGKNVMAATNALSCSNMALGGYDHLVPFDEVVVAMNKVAHQIPRELRCTNLGGLSITPTADRIAEKLAAKSGGGCGKVSC